MELIKEHFEKLQLDSFFDIEFVKEESDFTWDKIEYGIIAGFATWSEYSYTLFIQILDQIKGKLSSKIKLIIFDIDQLSINLQKELLLGDLMQGYFDCALVKQGKVIAKHNSKLGFRSFIQSVIDNQ